MAGGGLAVGPALDRRRGLLVRGEPGAGKLALLRGALAARGLSAPVFDAALEPVDGTAAWVTAVREQLAAGTGFVVLRHVELLGDQAARALAAVVDAAAEPASPFLVTSCASPDEPLAARPGADPAHRRDDGRRAALARTPR